MNPFDNSPSIDKQIKNSNLIKNGFVHEKSFTM